MIISSNVFPNQWKFIQNACLFNNQEVIVTFLSKVVSVNCEGNWKLLIEFKVALFRRSDAIIANDHCK